MTNPILSVRDVVIRFGSTTVVDNVSFDIGRNEFLGLVGESGSGKSVTALAIMGLLDKPGEVISGAIHFDGQRIDRLLDRQMQAIRGRRIGMIFQEPLNSLNPMFTVGEQIIETIKTHEKVSSAVARRRGVDLLKLVGIPAAEERFDEYPHRLSGGMRQRVMIAMALSCEPDLIIADEPTTALDVTIQAQILDLFARLRREIGLSVLFITHDLGVVAELTDRVAVMYAGRLAEVAPTADLFDSPGHPYTIGLMRSRPSASRGAARLHTIDGVVPNPKESFPGCRFAPRCSFASTLCTGEQPRLLRFGDHRLTGCVRQGELSP